MSKVDPFWMVLALNNQNCTVTVLGWSLDGSEEALAKIALRAAEGEPTKAFAMHVDATTISNTLRDWFISEGMNPEEAYQSVRALGKSLRKHLFKDKYI